MNKSHTRIFLILSLGFVVSSCETVKNESFDAGLVGTDVTFLDATGRSCKLQQGDDPTVEDDIQPVKAILGKIFFNWKGSNPLYLKYVRIVLTGAGITGGKQVFTISGQDLISTIGDSVIPPSTTGVTGDECIFEIGGIEITDKSQTYFGTGIFQIYATTLEGSSEVPVTSEQYFNYRYDGFGI